MLQGEHSAILSTFIKLPFVIKIFILSIFEWPFYTGFTVYQNFHKSGRCGSDTDFFTKQMLTLLSCLKLTLTLGIKDQLLNTTHFHATGDTHVKL